MVPRLTIASSFDLPTSSFDERKTQGERQLCRRSQVLRSTLIDLALSRPDPELIYVSSGGIAKPTFITGRDERRIH